MVDNGGVRLRVTVEGPEEGPPVLFVHGLSSSLETWDWLPPEVTEGRRIIRLDLRGHGGSDHTPDAYRLDRYASDALAVLRETTTEPAVYVGHSLGGSVGWWLAQSHPELLRAALLEDPPLYYGDAAEHASRHNLQLMYGIRETARAWQQEGADPRAKAEELARQRASGRSAPGEPAPTWGELIDPADLLADTRAVMTLDPETMTAMADRTTLTGTDVAAPISIPVLIVAAGLETSFPEKHERRLAETHPEIEVLRVEGAGHAVHLERPHRPLFVRTLAEFLDRHAPVGAGSV
ncbi:MAG TPA: alpha/beta hydrolase [Solirubrobacterales bacterium]|nr:alpha/beta hydrolase [Solirubrobacterales bacterium]